MPSVAENFSYWNSEYNWSLGGEEWSKRWGGSEAQWRSTVYPRVRDYLPVDSLLEIGPGFGRWTHYLANYARHLIAVDLSPRCIDACRKRFADLHHVEWIINNGSSLEDVTDGTIDFVFSFDSLVHADATVLYSYLRQLTKKLAPGAKGFLHHSNLGAYRDRLPPVPNPHHEHWRSRDVSAYLFRQICIECDLCCATQELVDWCNSGTLLDCFSIIINTPYDSVDCRVTSNWTLV